MCLSVSIAHTSEGAEKSARLKEAQEQTTAAKRLFEDGKYYAAIPFGERALALLEQIRTQITVIDPYRFSIRVSDILRRYVTEQFGLPVTRQTSVEFLNGLRASSPFSEDEKSLLEDFLNRCDLIKFARYEATTSDSELLLEEAIRFVKGGQPCLIGSEETVR